MRLGAEPLEERAVPRDDVVRVETVEPGRLGASDERRVAEDSNVDEVPSASDHAAAESRSTS